MFLTVNTELLTMLMTSLTRDADALGSIKVDPASNLYGTHIGPMWAPIWDPYGQCNRVPYGLAHVNKIK